jgi:hypothetical protein
MDRSDRAQAVFDSLTRGEDDIYLTCQICVQLRLFRWAGKKTMMAEGTYEPMRLLVCKACQKARWVTMSEIMANISDEQLDRWQKSSI